MIKKLCMVLALFCALFASDLDDFEAEFAQEPRVDKFYAYNKAMTQFNYAIYNMSLRPLSGIYNAMTPPPIKSGISNFFHNLTSPLRFVTLLLSGQLRAGLAELGTFVGNSTLGLGGIFRPFKYEKQSDFGLMMARWGVPAGEHIVLPFFGPSNIRDALTMPLNFALKPSFYLSNNASIYLTALELVDDTNKKKALINEAYKSVNPYIIIRDFYEKSRKEEE